MIKGISKMKIFKWFVVALISGSLYLDFTNGAFTHNSVIFALALAAILCGDS